jgi:membrane associated rhomboid family serine protease
VATRGRSLEGQMSLPVYDGPLEVRFRYRLSPRGALIGIGAGAGFGYAIGYGMGSSCKGSGCWWTPTESAGVGAAIFGIVGAVLGAFVGPKPTTVYRFHTDTPRQMSVVIGVGPTTTASGGSR